MIELKDFINSSISGIIDSVMELQEKYKDENVIICPRDVEESGGRVRTFTDPDRNDRLVTEVEMEVSVNAESNTKKSGNGGLDFKIVVAGVNEKDSNKNGSSSKLKFTIPIVLPHTDKA